MIDNTISASQGIVRPAIARSDAAGQAVASTVSSQAVAPPVEAQPSRGTPEVKPGEDMTQLLEGLSQRLNEFVQDNARELEFRVNDEGGRVVILVRQSETGEVLRTIPPEEALALADNLSDGAAALFSQLA